MIDAGELRTRIKIEQRGKSVDSYGEPQESWAEVKSCWAKVQPMSGREYFAAAQTDSQVTHAVTLRYLDYPALKPEDRIRIGPRILNIASVLNEDEGDEALICMCKEQTT